MTQLLTLVTTGLTSKQNDSKRALKLYKTKMNQIEQNITIPINTDLSVSRLSLHKALTVSIKLLSGSSLKNLNIHTKYFKSNR